jgi:tetratricopeptide (TPR) repeat protein
MPDRHPNDVYTMGQLYYQQRMYRRALLTLQQVKEWPDLRFRLLAAQCLLESKEYDQCLVVLDGAAEFMEVDTTKTESGIDTVAAMLLTKGKVYDLQQNRVKAAHWYQESVKRDVYCFEGFEKLIDSHMLTAEQERDLLASLSFSDDDEWLRVFYQSRVKKYDLSVDHPVNDADLAAFPHLANSLDLMTMAAEFYYYHNNFAKCYEETTAILIRDPYAHACLPAHLSSLVCINHPSTCQSNYPPHNLSTSPSIGTFVTASPSLAAPPQPSLSPPFPFLSLPFFAFLCLGLPCLAFRHPLIPSPPSPLPPSQVELGNKRELFIDAHKLVNEHAESAPAWYAVGCYYYLTNKFEQVGSTDPKP